LPILFTSWINRIAHRELFINYYRVTTHNKTSIEIHNKTSIEITKYIRYVYQEWP
jgi:hypothetical protein